MIEFESCQPWALETSSDGRNTAFKEVWNIQANVEYLKSGRVEKSLEYAERT